MKLCKTSLFKQNIGSTNGDEQEEDDYYNRLQKYSALYRILLARPYSIETKFNHWNRIDLKIVNELGLTLTLLQKSTCCLKVDCRLIVERDGHFTESPDRHIVCRPVQHDAWEFNRKSDMAGFFYSAEGNFEYMVTTVDEGIMVDTEDKYYIQIYPSGTAPRAIQAFPLVIGPIKCIEDKKDQFGSSWGYEDVGISRDILHAYSIPGPYFLMIKEKWELGTPGKMWDSALVISQMFSSILGADPSRYDGQRILDLSAGTGCVGLLLGLFYKMLYNKANLPQITLTDLPEALDLIYQNRATNLLQGYTDVQALTWGEYDDVQKVLLKGPIHTIIASDVLYAPASFSKLVDTLDWLSSDTSVGTNVDIFLGYKRRGLSPEEELSFFDICSQKFDIKFLQLQKSSTLNEGWTVNGGASSLITETGVHIYHLTRK